MVKIILIPYVGYNHEEEEYCAFIDKNCDNNKINNKWIINKDYNELNIVKKEKNNKKVKNSLKHLIKINQELLILKLNLLN